MSGMLEARIAEWRSHFRRRQTIRDADVAELEDHLRGQVEGLMEIGLDAEEAFLVAVKRMGALDSVAQEYAQEHSDRLRRQLVAPPEAGKAQRKDALVAFALAGFATVLLKLPGLFGFKVIDYERIYVRNFSLVISPFVAGYFAWKRALPARAIAILAGAFALAMLVININPFAPDSDTEMLAALHLPIALWVLVGGAYAGGRWSDGRRRMDFVRFTGELIIYAVLIKLGGAVLVMFTYGIFASIGADADWLVSEWLLPFGSAGTIIIAAWLVEAKKSVVENMAPVLGRLFTPLFAAVLLIFLGTMAFTGRGIDVDRDVLIAFDLLLVLVLGLLLYSISAREPEAPVGASDWLLVLLLVTALLVDVLALAAVVMRISDFGFTPNRVAALGENVILLVNLSWSAWLYTLFLRGRGSFRALERWQTSYLPVFAVWAAVVVVLFPPLFLYR